MEKLINTEDLYEECLTIYDYNIDALSLHILFFKKEIGSKKIFLSVIKKDLKENKINPYRNEFIKVLDSFMSDIKKFKSITEFNIEGIHVPLTYCLDNKHIIKELDNRKKVSIKKELIDILYTAERLMEEFKNEWRIYRSRINRR